MQMGAQAALSHGIPGGGSRGSREGLVWKGTSSWEGAAPDSLLHLDASPPRALPAQTSQVARPAAATASGVSLDIVTAAQPAAIPCVSHRSMGCVECERAT